MSRGLCRDGVFDPVPLMRIMIIMAPMATSEDAMSVSRGFTKLENRNWVPANEMPQTAAAGNTALRPFHPDITNTRYAGTIREIGAQMRPTPAERRSNGRPVVFARV